MVHNPLTFPSPPTQRGEVKVLKAASTYRFGISYINLMTEDFELHGSLVISDVFAGYLYR